MNLSVLKLLAEDATYGEWDAIFRCDDVCDRVSIIDDDINEFNICTGGGSGDFDEDQISKNMKYIAAVNPAAIIRLIIHIEYLKECNAELNEELRRK